MRRRSLRAATAALLLVAAAGCASPSADDVAVVSRPIVGGATAAACSWPSTVLAGGCSGILVHPRVVVTAAHCVRDGITQIDFGENELRVARTVRISVCTAHPNYNGNTDDIGVCVLGADVTGVPIVPVMAACEASLLAAGAPVMEVGFGQFVAPTGPNDGFGIKRWMAGTIRTVATSRGQIDATTGSQDGEYYGDSGGPLYFQMADGTWRVIGADSSSPDIIPGSTAARVSRYTSVPSHVAWLETTAGIDLTPCHDASGWNPTATCTGFPTNPADGVGAWASSCAGQTLVSPQATCGGMNTGGAGGGATGGRAGTGTGGATGGSGATGGAVGSGGATGTGGRAGGTGGNGTAVGGATAGTGGTSGGAGSGGSSPGATDSSDSGCACAISPAAPDGTAIALGLFALLGIRPAPAGRRRRRSGR